MTTATTKTCLPVFQWGWASGSPQSFNPPPRTGVAALVPLWSGFTATDTFLRLFSSPSVALQRGSCWEMWRDPSSIKTQSPAVSIQTAVYEVYIHFPFSNPLSSVIFHTFPNCRHWYKLPKHFPFPNPFIEILSHTFLTWGHSASYTFPISKFLDCNTFPYVPFLYRRRVSHVVLWCPKKFSPILRTHPQETNKTKNIPSHIFQTCLLWGPRRYCS